MLRKRIPNYKNLHGYRDMVLNCRVNKKTIEQLEELKNYELHIRFNTNPSKNDIVEYAINELFEKLVNKK